MPELPEVVSNLCVAKLTEELRLDPTTAVF